MFSFVAIFVPSILGVGVIEYFKKNINLKNSIYYYAILLAFSNVINVVVSYCLFDVSSSIAIILDSAPIYFCKYIVVSILVNCILAFLIVLFEKNISFEVEVVKNEKKKHNKRKNM